MPDLLPIARKILEKQGKEINNIALNDMIEELECCLKGRKVQILILLDNQDRLTSSEITELTKINGPNLALYTNRLKKNFLIEKYGEEKFKDPAKANYKYHYHSNTDIGKELIADLGE